MAPARAHDAISKIAPLLFVASSACFGCMAFAAKLAAARLPGSQVALIRFAISLLPILFWPPFRRAALTFNRLDLLFYRGFFGGTAVLLYFMAIQHIAVGLATLLNYTSPIFAGLFAAAFIGEPIRARVIGPLAVASAGVFLVVRAGEASAAVPGLTWWHLAGLCSAMLSGAAVTAIRGARRSEGSWSIFASFSLFGLLATAPLGIWQWKNPTPHEWLELVVMALLSIAAQLLMTYAYRWVETVIAGVISQFAVVIAMSLGWFFLSERITPLGLLGSALTITGVVLVMLVGSRPQPTAFDTPPEP
jgi:drug/metabolite transporter (DMT)-like permease